MDLDRGRQRPSCRGVHDALEIRRTAPDGEHHVERCTDTHGRLAGCVVALDQVAEGAGSQSTPGDFHYLRLLEARRLAQAYRAGREHRGGGGQHDAAGQESDGDQPVHDMVLAVVVETLIQTHHSQFVMNGASSSVLAPMGNGGYRAIAVLEYER